MHLFWLKIDDMALNNMGIPFDLDFVFFLGGKGFLVSLIVKKQADSVTGPAIGVVCGQRDVLDHPAGGIGKSLDSEDVVALAFPSTIILHGAPFSVRAVAGACAATVPAV